MTYVRAGLWKMPTDKGKQRLINLQAPAGYGKTFLLNCVDLFYREFKHEGTLACSALVGVAASLYRDGCTTHALLDCGIGECDREPSGDALERLGRLEGVVCDEISMANGNIMRAIKRNLEYAGKETFHETKLDNIFEADSLPYGGKTVILCGDLMQLDCVKPDRNGGFAWESPLWEDYQPIFLMHNFRQEVRCSFVVRLT